MGTLSTSFASEVAATRPFIVLALPRSRTCWLSHFLTYDDWICGHEELRHVRTLDDVRMWFSQLCIGTVETAAAPWWRLIDKFAPNSRIVTVRRPVHEVVDSLLHIPGLIFDRSVLEKAMTRLDKKLNQIEGRMNVLSVNYRDLENEDECARVFEHCLPYPHDHLHWSRLSPVNLQINLRAMMRHAMAYAPAMQKAAEIAKHHSLAEMHIKKPASMEGITFQVESYDTWIRDGVNLFRDHVVEIGEVPGSWTGKNLPLMKSLYEMGALQIMTARSNGRMFGYLMTLLTPSLSSANVKSAVHSTFFASKEFPGLGLKLQRAAIENLKQQGIDEVFMQAGTRGSGERISAIYKRLGAEKSGQMFRLNLAEV